MHKNTPGGRLRDDNHAHVHPRGGGCETTSMHKNTPRGGGSEMADPMIAAMLTPTESPTRSPSRMREAACRVERETERLAQETEKYCAEMRPTRSRSW
eukprot:6491382-Amphidinium_carterae.2